MNFPDPNLPPIVIVDDSDDDIFFFRRRLREAGLANPVLTFNSTSDALAYLRFPPPGEPRPRLIFTDIHLPGMNGFEFISQIREDPQWDDAKLVVLTFSNDPADLERAINLRVDGFLIKIPTADTLAQFVMHGPWFKVPRRMHELRTALTV
jgi:CheY-like chemotaxis protein